MWYISKSLLTEILYYRKHIYSSANIRVIEYRCHDMNKMHDMKMTKADMRNESPMMVGGSGPAGDRYPWGLEIQLDGTAIKKLSFGETPEAGEEVMLHACCLITRVSADANGLNSVTLQITKMAVMSMEDDEANEEQAAWAQAKADRKARY